MIFNSHYGIVRYIEPDEHFGTIRVLNKGDHDFDYFSDAVRNKLPSTTIACESPRHRSQGKPTPMRHPVLTTSWLVMVACVIGPLPVKGHAPIIRTGGDDNNDPAAAPDRGGGGRFSCGLME
jgi:hypothetical protein